MSDEGKMRESLNPVLQQFFKLALEKIHNELSAAAAQALSETYRAGQESERQKSARLVEALKRECYCVDEGMGAPSGTVVKCDPCEALAEYKKEQE